MKVLVPLVNMRAVRICRIFHDQLTVTNPQLRLATRGRPAPLRQLLVSDSTISRQCRPPFHNYVTVPESGLPPDVPLPARTHHICHCDVMVVASRTQIPGASGVISNGVTISVLGILDEPCHAR